MKTFYCIFLFFVLPFLTFSCEKEGYKKPPIPQPVIIKQARGIWMPDPSHTSALSNFENLKKSVALLDELNFNVLYVCTYAKNKVAWNSEVLLTNTNYTDIAQTNMYPNYSGGSNDMLKDLIDECHKKNIKVIFWFEYGFMSQHGNAATVNNNPILAQHPTWNAIAHDGTPAHYNNTDFYFNSYLPEVQQFLIDLMVESIIKYHPDGIQGDDRLPACARNSGYDDYTKNKYKTEKGTDPPNDFQNSDWVRFRLDILNNFAINLHKAVKQADSKCLVSFSPNPYPWCEQNLMQDTPAWLKAGIVDILNVQTYRTTTAAYESSLKTSIEMVTKNSSKQVLAPGIILKNGNTILPAKEIKEMMMLNRKYGLLGDTFFWFDGLYDESAKTAIKESYSTKVEFPY